jgi:hypothetical protein
MDLKVNSFFMSLMMMMMIIIIIIIKMSLETWGTIVCLFLCLFDEWF